ncbi:MAG: hypothetical protein PHP41_04780, partial [Bacilli bacterium]|nr:hypothetical protein [Bacilli bacterium]
MNLGDLTQEMLIQYFNLGVLAVIVLFGLIGFFRGTYKSLFYLIATAVIFGVGWLVMQPVITFLLNYDVSSYNLVVYGVQITSINAAVPAFVQELYPQLGGVFTEGTLTQELVTGLLSMIVKIVYFILLIVLAFSVFKVITDIFWMIFKPKKKGGKRKKKSFLSRLGGFGIGAAKGAFYVLLICVPLVGIASIAGSLSEVAEEQGEDLSYQLVFVGNSVTLVQSEEDLQTSPLGQYGEILELLGFYKNSVAGEVFETLKADEFIFDNLMSFEVNDVNIQLRKELQTVASAFSKAEGLMSEGFGIETLANADPDLLREIIDDITGLDLIKVIMPVGVEIALLMEDEEGNSIIDQLPNDPDNPDDDFSISDLRTIDFAADFASLGYALVDVTSLLPTEPDEQIDYFNLDGELVENIFTNVGNLDIIDTFAPIAVSYLVSMDEFQASLDQVGMTAEDLGIYDVESWGAEIANIGSIYRRLADLQLQNIQNFGGEDFDPADAFQYVTEEKVDLLSTALFNSTLITNALPVLVNQMSSQFLTGEFANLISFEGVTWNAEEFSSIFNATVTLVKSGILDTVSGGNPLESLTEDNINDLAKYLSQSNLIKKNLNNLIDMLLGGLDIFDDTTELIMLEDDEWTEAELTSLFQAARIIASQDLENLMSLEDETIEDLALYLSGSQFIVKNLSGIIDKLIGSLEILGADTEIITLTEEEWTQNELESLFKAGKLISETDLEDLGALTDDTIEDLALYLSGSTFITRNLNGIIEELLAGLNMFGEDVELVTILEEEWTQEELTSLFKAGQIISSQNMDNLTNLEDATIEELSYHLSHSKFITSNLNPILDTALESINLGDDIELGRVDDWSDPVQAEGELVSIFKSAKIITEKGSSADAFLDITDEELDILLGSELISETLVNVLQAYSAEGKELDFLVGANDEGVVWYDTDEIVCVFEITGTVLTITPAEGTNKYNIYADGEKDAATRALTFDLSTLTLDNPTPTYEMKGFDEGELRK